MSCCIPLSYLSTETSTVSWSADQRIAVTTSEAIYILTLKGVRPTPASKTRPPFVMSTVPAPENFPPLNLGVFHRVATYKPTLGGLSHFLDHTTNTSQSCDFFKASHWTPAGCNHLGGCLLSCVTLGGRLLLYFPPGRSSSLWRLTADLSVLFVTLLRLREFQLEQNAASGSGDEEEAEPSKKKAKQETPEGSFAVYVHRKLMVSCTEVAWLPSLLHLPTGEQIAMVAMATRSGHVTLWGLQVPVVKGSHPNLQLLRVIQLPLTDHQDWACGLQWSCGLSGTSLLVGCTNGQVLSLHWRELVVSVEEGEGGRMTLPIPLIAPLWPLCDGIAVHHLACWWKWVVVSKGPRIVALSLADWLQPSNQPRGSPPPHIWVSNGHTMPVSGLCSLPDGSFVSCALDGSVQRFTLPEKAAPESCDSHVTPQPVSMETVPSGQVYSTQGIAVSQNGIFAAIAVNPRCDTSYNKVKFHSQLHFLTLSNSTTLQEILRQKVVVDWDVCECLRQQCTQEMELPGYVQDLVARGSGSSPHKMQFRLQLHTISQQDPRAVQQCEELIHHSHIMDSLIRWKAWKEGRDTEMDSQSSVSLSLMCQWLRFMCQWLISTESSNPTSAQLAQEILEELPQNTATEEMCPICGANIPLSSLQQESCSNGHVWKRCSISLCLATEPTCSQCILCGTYTHSTQSLDTQPGSWLHHLLSANSQCIFCNGYFEQIV